MHGAGTYIGKSVANLAKHPEQTWTLESEKARILEHLLADWIKASDKTGN